MAECQPIELGGYQYDYVEDPPEQLTCPICLLPFRDPNIVNCCGAKYCETCIARVQLANNPCPLCRTRGFDKMIDKQCQRHVLALRVRCNYKDNGCPWIGELRHIWQHLEEECEYVPVLCKYNCGHQCFRKDMMQHEEDECEMRPLELKLIKKVTSLEKRVKDLEEQCEQQGRLLEGQRQELEVQKRGVAQNKEEIDARMNLVDERHERMELKTQEIERSHDQYKIEQEEQNGQHLLKFQEIEMRITELLENVNEQIKQLKADFKKSMGEQRRDLEDLIKLKSNETVELVDKKYRPQIEQTNMKLDHHKKLLDELKGSLQKQEGDNQRKLDALRKDLENEIKERKTGLTRVKETYQKEFEKAKEVIVESLTKQDNELKDELLEITENRIKKSEENFAPNDTLKLLTSKLDKMCVGFKVPGWQKPLPLNLFSDVPPCQFTMMRFNYHKTEGRAWYSPPFYSEPGGYKLCLRIDPNGMLEGKESHLSVWVYVMKGKFDDSLKWPFSGKVTVQLLNWVADRGHIQNIVSFDDAAGEKVRARVTNGKYAATGRGSSKFLPHSFLPLNAEKKTLFMSDDCLCFRISKVEVLC